MQLTREDQTGKLECILGEASHLQVDILGMAEVRWINSEKFVTDDHVLIYIRHKHGVDILLTKKVAKSLMGFPAVSESEVSKQTREQCHYSSICTDRCMLRR